MNARERVIAALRHEQPDKVPYSVHCTVRMFQRMVEYYGDPHFMGHLDNALASIGCEPEPSYREVAPDVFEDQFGVRWNRRVDKDIGVVCNRMITPETLNDYEFPDPDAPFETGRFEEATREPRERFLLANIGFSLFERAWTLCGMETILMAMVADKAFVHEILDRICDFNLKLVENACRYDVDGVRFGDDWGQQTGLIMGPDHWREFIEPRVRRMYAAVRQQGKYVFIHSCGKVDAIFPDLIECGLHCFNPFQPEVMDVYEMKHHYGDDLTFYGGISTQRTLPYGSVHDVREEVRRLLSEVGEGGGYIAAPAHSIPGDAKPENVAAMIEELQAQ